MTDTSQPVAVFRCPSCGKPTTENLPTCRHCRAILEGPKAGAKKRAIIDTGTPTTRWGCAGVGVLLALLAVGGVVSCNHEAANNARIEAKHKADEQKEEDTRYAERVKSGEVCADGPNDLNTAFELNVKRHLKDSESFEHLGTVIKPIAGSSEYDALMRYRARNSFGALTVGTAVGKLYVVEKNICEVRSFKIIQ